MAPINRPIQAKVDEIASFENGKKPDQVVILHICVEYDPAKPEEFMTGTGGHGFAPTDIDVGPDGCLYVCVGGRGTRGAAAGRTGDR